MTISRWTVEDGDRFVLTQAYGPLQPGTVVTALDLNVGRDIPPDIRFTARGHTFAADEDFVDGDDVYVGLEAE